jgi:hypothetical protein
MTHIALRIWGKSDKGKIYRKKKAREARQREKDRSARSLKIKG